MAKRMLADVLWEAANRFLMTAHEWHPTKSYYTCDAVYEASGDPKASLYLVDLGCPGGHGCFIEFAEGMERQGVRYMWLLLAMHVAEDERIEL
jgi:hypothetical protein